VKKVNYDIPNAREELVETLWRGILAEGIFEYCAEKVRYWA
jgi:hypothetical protein